MTKAIVLFACIFSMCVKPPKYVAVSDKSVEVYSQTITNKELKVLSIGGFYKEKKVEKLYLDLEYKGVLSDKNAEEKIITVFQGLLEHVNKDSSLKEFLIENPFSKKDLSVTLSYTSEKGRASQVHIYEDEVVFSTYNKTTNELIKDYTIPLVRAHSFR